MTNLIYKDFVAEIKIDFENSVIVGKIINLPKHIVFYSETVLNVKQIFHKIVDEYICECEHPNFTFKTGNPIEKEIE